MAFRDELEKQVNTSLIIASIKIKALKSVLTEEQLKKYSETISQEKVKMQSVLADLLTKEELDEALKALGD
ncbi:hypothetical protein [Flavobacterium cerinum]|uniref:Uncharacterized protein n=1 Tax=Flavobacterium cerinum TaxID=2502784 RepID=A0A3S3QUB1_9FLAO|nr:hypothetical protein [Flavobacterium cerinum]RWW92350.1 hypothetical protein EPI11_15685 [Flavobacterium cerinum]